MEDCYLIFECFKWEYLLRPTRLCKNKKYFYLFFLTIPNIYFLIKFESYRYYVPIQFLVMLSWQIVVMLKYSVQIVARKFYPFSYMIRWVMKKRIFLRVYHHTKYVHQFQYRKLMYVFSVVSNKKGILTVLPLNAYINFRSGNWCSYLVVIPSRKSFLTPLIKNLG